MVVLEVSFEVIKVNWIDNLGFVKSPTKLKWVCFGNTAVLNMG